MINVFIVEDSLVTRQHLKHLLERDGTMRVIGMAEDGMGAISFLQENTPDVITMDINMPGMNGLDATRRIMETAPLPIVIVSASYNRNDVEMTFRAIEAGAVAIIEKPFGKGHPDHEAMSDTLIRTVMLMSEVKVIKRRPKKLSSSAISHPIPSHIKHETVHNNIKIITIGASTGGPLVIRTILSGLRKGFPAPLMIVQHIASGFLKGLVDWLIETTEHPIHIAVNCERMLPGHAYLAPDDSHMGVERAGRIVLSKSAPENGVRPSVSYLFRSASDVFGKDMAGVLLTGMGCDGAKELKLMKDRGAVTIAQDKKSSVVFGMPGEAVKLGGARHILPPDTISATLEYYLQSAAKRGSKHDEES